ncbi:unnamed protein product [Pleuronectes platessa]|uniref:Uncharacterized protein n=1 Tax=Pleuronectes platessa TaxID=8262 RepID=A0A9N7YVZ8_PLEPL|nr:unnamed protein product [Pleuronectes platessa]
MVCHLTSLSLPIPHTHTQTPHIPTAARRRPVSTATGHGSQSPKMEQDSGSWGADKAPFRGPRPGDNGWARLSPLLHSSNQRLILQMGFPVAGKAKRRALLFVTGHCASRLRTNLLDGLDK